MLELRIRITNIPIVMKNIRKILLLRSNCTEAVDLIDPRIIAEEFIVRVIISFSSWF